MINPIKNAIKSRILKMLFIGVFLITLHQISNAKEMTIKINTKEPTFVLPQFSGPFREREASVSPKEYEMAEELREMLDTGRKQEALAKLEEFFSLEVSVAMVLLKAQIYFQVEEYKKAEIAYKEALDRMPQLNRAHGDLGQLYLVQDKKEKARIHFAKAIQYGSNDPIIHGQLGILNLKEYNAWSAINAFQNAMVMEPNNMQWKIGLLEALTTASMMSSAIALVDEMISLQPENPDLWLRKASLFLEQESYKEALACMELAIKFGASDSSNLQATAQLHFRLNSYQRGLEIVESQLKNNTLNEEVLVQVVSWLLTEDMSREAEKLLDIAMKSMNALSNDSKANLYYLTAEIQRSKNKLNKAESHYKKALELNPANAQILLAYAEMSREAKKYNQAELLYTRAQTDDKFRSQAMRGKARLFIDMKDYSSALSILRSEYQKYPNMADLKENIRVLESISSASALNKVEN